MKVKVAIKTSQYMDDGKLQTIESFFKGERLEKNGCHYVKFSEFETFGDSKGTIKVSDDEVIILKSGDVVSNMRFREKERFRSRYQTIYGDFNMSLYTYKISKRVNDEEIKLNLDYNINIEGLMNANNRVEIKVVKEA